MVISCEIFTVIEIINNVNTYDAYDILANACNHIVYIPLSKPGRKAEMLNHSLASSGIRRSINHYSKHSLIPIKNLQNASDSTKILNTKFSSTGSRRINSVKRRRNISEIDNKKIIKGNF